MVDVAAGLDHREHFGRPHRIALLSRQVEAIEVGFLIGRERLRPTYEGSLRIVVGRPPG